MKRRNLFILVHLTLLIISVMAGCSSTKNDPNTQQEGRDRIKIVVAVTGTTNGYAYTNDQDELIGYNIDVLHAAFKKLPQYELSFIKTDFQSIFSGLDAGIYQIGGQAFIANPERREKYLFSNSHGKYIFRIVVAADNTDIGTWHDLGGKVTEEIVGDGPVAIIEAYNKEYPNNAITLHFIDNNDSGLQHLIDHKIDFQINSYTTALLQAREYGLENQIKFVAFGEDAPSYFNTNQYYGFLLSKTEQHLADDVNGAIQELIRDGVIEELSKKWFAMGELAVSIEESNAFRDGTL